MYNLTTVYNNVSTTDAAHFLMNSYRLRLAMTTSGSKTQTQSKNSPSPLWVPLSAPTRSRSCQTCAGRSAEPERTLKHSQVIAALCWRCVKIVEWTWKPLTWIWDSGVMFGSFSLPTDTESMDSPVENKFMHFFLNTFLHAYLEKFFNLCKMLLSNLRKVGPK